MPNKLEIITKLTTFFVVLIQIPSNFFIKTHNTEPKS